MTHEYERGFQYQLVGVKHAAMLAVSLYTLRQYHSEPVQIVCGDMAAFEAVMSIIVDDKGLGNVEWFCWEAPKEGGKGRQHANKATAVAFSPFDKTIFLDADTTVHARLDDLWPKSNEIHLTRFSEWQTTGGIMRGRLEQWRGVMADRVHLMQTKSFPAINTGVFSFSKDCQEYLEDWKNTTEENPIFMADELAAQLIYIDHPHVVHNDRWNYSPRYSTPGKEQIRVVHYHGMQHARPEKSDGYKIWTMLYRECHQQNRAGIRNLNIVDKHLRSWLEANPHFLRTGNYA